MKISTALISVADKTGIADFAARLDGLGIRLVSSSGTAAHLRDHGLEVLDVGQWTGFDECLDGRVKTLHPAIHAAILADRSRPDHMESIGELADGTIDLVVVDLYDFQEAMSGSNPPLSEAIEEIDIGGVAMARAAAKNFEDVAVVVDSGDYTPVAEAIEEERLDRELRRTLAVRAFEKTTSYDRMIADVLADNSAEPTSEAPFEKSRQISLRRRQQLRYGENPHQKAALYSEAPNVDDDEAIEQLHGKALSYNNLVDLDAALQLIWEFDEPAAAIIKHTNPTGCAIASTIRAAFEEALAGDPMSAFGGIVAVNRRLDASAAQAIDELFVEIVAAPEFDDQALEILQRKTNTRLMRWNRAAIPRRSIRNVVSGWLVQDTDRRIDIDVGSCDVPTEVEPGDDLLSDLAMAWRVVKHVKSNAIVLVKDGQVIGVGAGQMSRVDAVEIAIDKCVAAEPEGAVLASDAFFPFRDGPDRAAEAGIRAMIQPGGSRNDNEVIEACDEHQVAMVMTGMRHFRHG